MKPKKNLNFFWALLLFVLIFPLLAFAHPGGRDANGCHVCRTNCDKYGVLFNAKHCHVKATTTPQSPISIPAPVQRNKSIPAKVISVKTREAETGKPIKIQTAQAVAPFFSKTSTLWLASAVGVGIMAALGFIASKRV